jgi:hypothetical protein
METIIGVVVGLVVLAVFILIYRVSNVVSRWRNIIIAIYLMIGNEKFDFPNFSALGEPLLDISLSLAFFDKYYGVTFRNFNTIVDFVWKLVTACMVFPKAASPIVTFYIGTIGNQKCKSL